MRAIAAPVFAALLMLAACGGDDSSSAQSTSTAAQTSTSTAASTSSIATTAPSSSVPPTTAMVIDCVGAAPVPPPPQSSPMPSDVMLLTAVHVSTQPCRDTITFDFTSSAPEQPGYRVSYEPGPFTQDASGKPVTITGKAFLVVRLEPATGFDFNNNRETYTGPDRVPTPGTKWVEDLVRTGDFESVTTWVIGVNKRVQFTATGTGAPNHRLTITLGT